MSGVNPLKLVPRNAPAVRRASAARDGVPAAQVRRTPGNPVSSRLESGVGNCFPGLECDLRNLERRFFPFVEVDIAGNAVLVANVDEAGVSRARTSGAITSATAAAYRAIGAGGRWRITTLTGRFTALGSQTLELDTLDDRSAGSGRRPPDAWTAIRLLEEGSEVTATFTRDSDGAERVITARRAAYLDADGALAISFQPGELTQSLCSPWTHDFRDCGCFYWSSNHPDIAMPPVPAGELPDNRRQRPVNWQRIRTEPAFVPSAASTSDMPESEFLPYYRINTAWELLNFVLDGREQLTPYEPGATTGVPFATPAELEQALRLAAGVELAVIHEYLAAAYSLRDSATLSGDLRGDVRAAEAELLRIAFGEMRHLRAVNDVLQTLPRSGPFQPALRVATAIPGVVGAVQPRPAQLSTLDRFIDIERPSASVDGLYARILATLEISGTDEQEQTVRSIMGEGTDHLRTFSFIREWLARHPESAYLRPNLQRRELGNPPPEHQALQQAYLQVLNDLYAGYSAGLPGGAPRINAARAAMPAPGLDRLARAVAAAGFLVEFDASTDPRFLPIP
ncbi:MAG TPA: ferritin-like domain-containing protein [Polyangiaceae bacterium]|nr:ferritin-like domain-containing protein [Polyangiaceae bacterium]